MLISASALFAEDEAPDAEQALRTELQSLHSALDEQKKEIEAARKESDMAWTIIAGVLVFFMQAGFAYVEAGFIRVKNVVNILAKNVIDFVLGTIFFTLIGFAIMFGPQMLSGIGIGAPQLGSDLLWTDGKPDTEKFTFLFFQLVFCGTAATIVSGAMAERTKFTSYIVYTMLISAFVYPVFGSLAWSSLYPGGAENKGLLANMGFIDFAGSTVVHSIGGWIGLAGAIVLGPRIGKFQKDGRILPIFGHNISMATLGVFILWFGWFGFNPGSTLSVRGGHFATIAVTTNMAAATGGLAAMITSWILFRRPDLSMVLNGILGGLVAITSPCFNVSVFGAATIGLVAGIVVVLSVIFFDKIHIDDPVGAVSVHGVCGAWGTLSAGLFAHPDFGDGVAGLFYGGGWKQVGVQAIGIGVAFAWAFGVGLLLFLLMKYTIGLRVSEEEEVEGLDVIEHGNEAYPEHG
ncbi:MAG: ammonium transporter [Leptospirales bacterium]|nr:ammonium transporter [Leptospirales bacterium]